MKQVLTCEFDVKFPSPLLFIGNRDFENTESITFRYNYQEFCIHIICNLYSSRVAIIKKDKFIRESLDGIITVNRDEDENLNTFSGEFNSKIEWDYRDGAIAGLKKFFEFFKYKYNHATLPVDILSACACIALEPKWKKNNEFIIQRGSHYRTTCSIDLSQYETFDIEPYMVNSNSLFEIEEMPKLQLHEELLSDARGALMQGNLKRAVLEMAIACEVYVKQIFFKMNDISCIVFSYLQENKDIQISVTELIDKVSLKTFGKSFKHQYKEEYDNIDFLFRTRNKIAHQGECYYTVSQTKNKQNEVQNIPVEKMCIIKWRKSVKILFEWLECMQKLSINHQEFETKKKNVLS